MGFPGLRFARREGDRCGNVTHVFCRLGCCCSLTPANIVSKQLVSLFIESDLLQIVLVLISEKDNELYTMSSVASSKEDTMSSEKADEKQPEAENKAEESDEDEEEEEEEEEEKEKSLIVEGKREKKKVDRLTMQVSSLQKEPFTITPDET
ncbi:protein hypothetical protein [Limosa lapponica baueri]|uniref:Uncharacterized protein n=1 Tax=Limosa lapponica baueri TaxID=1758121 RepID=A0A2I0TP76_LIMLA|nr:protein hypothetical protein [Limosa lapponica baueri]